MHCEGLKIIHSTVRFSQPEMYEGLCFFFLKMTENGETSGIKGKKWRNRKKKHKSSLDV